MSVRRGSTDLFHVKTTPIANNEVFLHILQLVFLLQQRDSQYLVFCFEPVNFRVTFGDLLLQLLRGDRFTRSLCCKLCLELLDPLLQLRIEVKLSVIAFPRGFVSRFGVCKSSIAVLYHGRLAHRCGEELLNLLLESLDFFR
ncbi:hypothetical protein PINS_up004118 [Pythium insidiosum]|nr:hypothetical protein PINS_up004118 [Pythium insidiosum]